MISGQWFQRKDLRIVKYCTNLPNIPDFNTLRSGSPKKDPQKIGSKSVHQFGWLIG